VRYTKLQLKITLTMGNIAVKSVKDRSQAFSPSKAELMEGGGGLKS
jgi:hypothetical protein